MQTTERSRIDRNALRSSFSIMNSIPLVARRMGEITAVAKKISTEIFSFPTAIKVSPETTKIVNVNSNPKFIRFTIDFIRVSLEDQKCMKPYDSYALEKVNFIVKL